MVSDLPAGPTGSGGATAPTEALLAVRGLSIRYGEKVALQGVDLEVRQN